MEYQQLVEEKNIREILDECTRVKEIPLECIVINDLSRLKRKSGNDIFYQMKSDPTCFRRLMFYEYDQTRDTLITVIHIGDKFLLLKTPMEKINRIWIYPVTNESKCSLQ